MYSSASVTSLQALSELAASAESSPRMVMPIEPPEVTRRRAFTVRLHDEILEFVSVVKGMVVKDLKPKEESMTRRVETLVRNTVY